MKPTHKFLIPHIALVLSWHLVCVPDAPCQSVSGVQMGRLRVWPERIIVSQTYPAQLTVQGEFEDGTSTDLSSHPDLMCRSEQPDLVAVEVESNGTVIIQAKQVGRSRIDVTLGKQSVSCDVEVVSQEQEQLSFPRDIVAVLTKTGCNLGTCHGNLHGKGGFRLSLRGDDPAIDFAAIVRDRGGRRIDWVQPHESLILQKPTGGVAHQGGVRFDTDHAGYVWLSEWIRAGTPWRTQQTKLKTGDDEVAHSDSNQEESLSASEEVVALEVYPKEARLRPESRTQQIVVQARFADGGVRDVTRWARFEANIVEGTKITDTGMVLVEKPMEVVVAVSYLQGRSASRLIFLPPGKPDAGNGPEPVQPIDQLVQQRLRRMQLAAEPLATEHEFLRRIYLVTVGRLPSADETRHYLSDRDPAKRYKLTRKLTNDPDYALMWALHWSDLLRNEQKVMSAQGSTQWHRWFFDQVQNDRPLDEMVRDLITSVGSTYENPPASFHRTHRDPATAAESVAQVFLGVRLQCAKCHNHPFDVWRQDDYYGLAAYFATVERKQLENAPKDKFDKHIITGDEIVSLTDKPARIRHPGRVLDVGPKPLVIQVSRERAVDGADGSERPLDALADWLTKDNRGFARNMANRIWYHVMGKGIVDPPDDFRDSNPPSNPELLEYLTNVFIESGYSTRHLTQLILDSDTFARRATPEIVEPDTLPAQAVFAGYPMRRLPAEVLLDVICEVTEVPWKFEGKDEVQPAITQRVIAMPGVPARANLLTAFGKPNRLMACECERSGEVSLGQSLLLINGEEVRDRLAASSNRISRLLEQKLSTVSLIEELYLVALTRYPAKTEIETFVAYVDQASDRRAAIEDVLWALMNSKEFILIR